MVRIIDMGGKVYEAESIREFMDEMGLKNTSGTRKSLRQTLQRDSFYKGFKVLENSGRKRKKEEFVAPTNIFGEELVRNVILDYTVGKLTQTKVSLKYNLTKEEVREILKEHGITKDAVPFTEEDILNKDERELASEALKVKKRAILLEIENLEIEEMKRENKKFKQRDYVINSLVEGLDGISIPVFNLENKKLGETNRTAVIYLSDLHIGSVHESTLNVFNKHVARDRFEHITKTIINRLDPDTKVIIVGAGDNQEGLIHTSGRILTDMDSVEATKFATQMFLGMIEAFTSYFNQVEMYSVHGNHDRMIPDKTASLDTENFNEFIIWYLELATRDIPNFKLHKNRIYGVAEFRIYGYDCAVYHGHQAGLAQAKRLEDLVAMKLDRIVMGHFHNYNVKSAGTTKVTVVPSFVGSGAYSVSKFLHSRPCQILEVYEEDGTITSTEIFLDRI